MLAPRRRHRGGQRLRRRPRGRADLPLRLRAGRRAMPVQRLWISSLTDEAIRAGVRARCAPASELRRCSRTPRARAPRPTGWSGMNATRAVTVRRAGPTSTARSRSAACRRRRWRSWSRARRRSAPSCPRPTGRSVDASPRPESREALSPAATTRGKGRGSASRPWPRRSPRAIARRPRARRPDGPVVEQVTEQKSREPPPLLFDLTSLQRDRQPPLRASAPPHARDRPGASTRRTSC